MVTLKSAAEVGLMREAGAVVAEALRTVGAAAKPGVTLRELDELAADVIRNAGAKPSFLGYRPYRSVPPFPGVLCLSVDDAVVHGIPNGHVLREGQLLSIDCGAIVGGYHADAATTVAVGTADAAGERLCAATRAALDAAIAAMVPGGHLGDVSHAVQRVAAASGYGILRDHGGHGIGTEMHQEPHILNYGRPGQGPELLPGVCLAIEPMVTLGKPGTYTMPDEWTVKTTAGGFAAHWEHSIAVTEDGPVVLTSLPA